MIRKATKKDLQEIEYWLEQEDKDDEGSFWCNINIIREAQAEHRLYAFVDQKAVAFLLGTDSSLDILAVKKDQRRKGYGRMLAEYYLEKLWKRGVLGLRIQCRPIESISFWKKMGFIMDLTCTQYLNDCYMYTTRPRQRDASNHANIISVEVKHRERSWKQEREKPAPKKPTLNELMDI